MRRPLLAGLQLDLPKGGLRRCRGVELINPSYLAFRKVLLQSNVASRLYRRKILQRKRPQFRESAGLEFEPRQGDAPFGDLIGRIRY